MHRLRKLGILAALALLVAACGPTPPPADTHLLTVTVVGDGVVNFDTAAGDDAAGENNVAKDSEVTLVATPNAGSAFVGWTGDVCAGEGATCTFTMDGAKSITATFEAVVVPEFADVTVDFTGSDGSGTVTSDAGHDCSFDGTTASGTCLVEDLPTNEVITFTAAPEAGTDFAGWAGAAATCGTDLTCEVTPADGAVTVTAVFDDPTIPVGIPGSVAIAATGDDGIEWVTPAIDVTGDGDPVGAGHEIGDTHNSLDYAGLAYVNRWGAEVINGFIFRDLGIPAGATITDAYIQFTSVFESGAIHAASNGTPEETSLVISAEASLDPATIPHQVTTAQLSTRPTVGTPIVWDNIPVWTTKGVAGPEQQTVDISALLQAVVDQDGWDENGDANFMIQNNDADATVGWRQITTFDEAGITGAPVLHFTYTLP